MPYEPKLRHLFKILFRVRDVQAAEGLYFEGTYLNDQGDTKGAREAFDHARRIDRQFAGAHYNYAALTERMKGSGREALAAWKDYLKAAETDRRQARATVEAVRKHVEELEKKPPT